MLTINVERTASRGVAMGKAFIMESEALSADKRMLDIKTVDEEMRKYRSAIDCVQQELSSLARSNFIFAAHLEIVKDETLHDEVVGKIAGDFKNAEWALEEVIHKYIDIFSQMEDEYMRARSADIKDIGNRVIRSLKGLERNTMDAIQEQVIIVAKELNPSDTARIKTDCVKGFITQEGSVTSHVSIMAKNLNCPALVGVDGVLTSINHNDYVILDATNGLIIVNPDDEVKERYSKICEENMLSEKELNSTNELPTVTRDGRTVKLYANAGSIQDITLAAAMHVDGIGLFRTEFLYMENSRFPSEEEQFAVYKQAAEIMGEKELVIRTLDIGGDKNLPYFDFGLEANPFLGYRAIRVCLDKESVFKEQLRAILRTSVFGNVSIMYPMIISVEELDAANALLALCREELRQESIPYNEKLKVGMMIETPASVVCADVFAKKVDFFSIGTNDLTQYTLAADRGNKKIAGLYNPFHPALLRSIERVMDVGHDAGIEVGICGEFAGDERAVGILLGLGLDKFSISLGSVPRVKKRIRECDSKEAASLSKKVLGCGSVKEIAAFVN